MVRQYLKDKELPIKDGFRLRGTNGTRIEALTDGVFALAITLLIIASEVPSNFSEMQDLPFQLIPFAMCISSIMWIWNMHYSFFVRYGLSSVPVVLLNTLLILIVIFYVYPLKFLATLLSELFALGFRARATEAQVSSEHIFPGMIEYHQLPTLMLFYGFGILGIQLIYALMYWQALRQRKVLALNELEVYDTKHGIRIHMVNACVPLLSLCIVGFNWGWWEGGTFTLSGMVYMLHIVNWPLALWNHKRRNKRFFKDASTPEASPPEASTTEADENDSGEGHHNNEEGLPVE